MSDWDRYAAQEYELLVAEEGGETQGWVVEEFEVLFYMFKIPELKENIFMSHPVLLSCPYFGHFSLFLKWILNGFSSVLFLFAHKSAIKWYITINSKTAVKQEEGEMLQHTSTYH